MFNVEIAYKSGKVEITEIAINKYLSALLTLTDESRVSGMRVISVK